MPYLVDGNNLLGSWGGPRDGNDRRREVIRRVASFCRAKRVKATLVFDGAPDRSDVGGQDLSPVLVRFPPVGQDADTVIRELVERAERPSELIVVTSDKALYSYVKTIGARVMRAHEWNQIERRHVAAASAGDEKPEREDDVEGWLKTFGERDES